MIKAISIGDNICDKYLYLNQMFAGGQSLNFAVHCKLQGHKAAHLGVFGSDNLAQFILETLSQLGVENIKSYHEQGLNGYTVVDLVDGERIFIDSNQGGVSRTKPLVLNVQDLEYISHFDVIHASNNGYIDSQLLKLAQIQKLLSYDFANSWADEERAKTICKFIDFGFLSCSDMTDKDICELLRKMQNWGAKLLVATRGILGAIAFDGYKFYKHIPNPVKPLDSLGAGDTFIAGFLMHYIDYTKNNNTIDSAKKHDFIMGSLKKGSEMAAKTCMFYGAFGHGANIK